MIPFDPDDLSNLPDNRHYYANLDPSPVFDLRTGKWHVSDDANTIGITASMLSVLGGVGKLEEVIQLTPADYFMLVQYYPPVELWVASRVKLITIGE